MSSSTFLAAIYIGTFVYNLIDSPVGHIPVARVDPAKDALTDSWWSADDHGSKVTEDLLYKGDSAFYNPEAMKGLPVGVQVVGRLWEDEKLVEVMKIVDGALGRRGFGPRAQVPHT
jgi:hypothetical protein